MEIVEHQVPERPHREALFEAYVPIVRQFVKSGQMSGKVVWQEGDEPASKFPYRLKSAISHMGGVRAVGVKVVTRKDDTFLVRVGNEQEKEQA